MYLARTREGERPDEGQLLIEHLLQVAVMARERAEKIGSPILGEVVGLLHDVGKYSDDFQRKIRGARIRTDHSTAGAALVEEVYGIPLGRLFAYVIAGHHTGLPDGGGKANPSSLLSRIDPSLNRIPDFSAYQDEIQVPNLPDALENLPSPSSDRNDYAYSFSFFIRMLYSCLVDADSLDAEAFGSSEREAMCGQERKSAEALANDLWSYHKTRFSRTDDSWINTKRREIWDACGRQAADRPGLFTLTVPTGGGKTLSSLRFALEHARIHKLEADIKLLNVGGY